MKRLTQLLRQPLENITFITLDIETTGLSPIEDKIVEIAGVKFTLREEKRKFHSLINPRIPIPEDVSRIHGIRDRDVKGKPTIREILPSLREFLGWDNILLLYNAWFDLSFLAKAFYDHHITPPPLPVVDIYKLLRFYKESLALERLSLRKVVETLGKKKSFQFHRAMGDSLALREIFLGLVEKKKIRNLGEILQEKDIILFSEGYTTGNRVEGVYSFLNQYIKERKNISLRYRHRLFSIIPLDIVKAGKKYYLYSSILPTFEKKFFELEEVREFVLPE